MGNREKVFNNNNLTNNYYLSIILTLVITIFLIGCSSNKDFKKFTLEVIKDSLIDEKEWLFLKDLCKKEYKNCDSSITVSKVKEITKNNIINPKFYWEFKSLSPYVNLFIDNSISMRGYFNGNNEIRHSLAKLLSDIEKNYSDTLIKYYCFTEYKYKDKLKIDINEIPFEGKPVNFPFNLNIGDFKLRNTDLKLMLECILNKTDNNSISIFVTDFIYSFSKRVVSSNDLEEAKIIIRDIFMNKLKEENFTTAINKFSSLFNGSYINMNNVSLSYLGKRPYYMIIIGKNDLTSKFLNSLNIRSLSGYEEGYTIMKLEGTEDPNYCVLREYNKLGIFQSKFSNDKIKRINIVELDPIRKCIQFSVAMDIRTLNCEENYMNNIYNYQITDSIGFNDFEVLKIEKITNDLEMPYNDRKILNDDKNKGIYYTHIITIIGENLRAQKYNLKLSLINNMPNWISESSTDNDTQYNDLINGKTICFKQVIAGIYEAYRDTKSYSNNFFSVKLNVEKK